MPDSLDEKRERLAALKAEEVALIQSRSSAPDEEALVAEHESLDAQIAEMEERVKAQKDAGATLPEPEPAPEVATASADASEEGS